MSLYKKFKTDSRVENEGIWIDFGESGRIRIARAGGSNGPFVRAMERVHREYRKQIQLDVLDAKKSVDLLVQVYADTVVLGWEGVTGEDGKPLPFNRENCAKLLRDLPDLFRELQEHAGSMALFRESILEQDAKNS